MLIKMRPWGEKSEMCSVWGDAPSEALEIHDIASQKEKNRESFSTFSRQAI